MLNIKGKKLTHNTMEDNSRQYEHKKDKKVSSSGFKNNTQQRAVDDVPQKSGKLLYSRTEFLNFVRYYFVHVVLVRVLFSYIVVKQCTVTYRSTEK